MSLIKSIRLEEEVANKIGKDANFSNLANQAINEYLNKSVWIPNFQIEKHANITATQVMERVKNVKYLRSNESALTFTFYPVSEDEIKRNKNIHAYANGYFNSVHDGFVYFNIKFPVNMLLFLKSKTWNQVQDSTHGFLSLLYWLDEDSQIILERQLEKKTLKSVIKIVEGSKFKKIKEIHKNYKDESGPKMRAEYNHAYFQLLIELGIDPVIFPYVGRLLRELHYPFHFKDVIFSENSGYDVKLAAGYMRDIYEDTDDWSSIVVQGSRGDDDLHRAESSAEPWESWVEEYSFFHYQELNTKGIRRVKKMLKSKQRS
jgi:hypothetical protein